MMMDWTLRVGHLPRAIKEALAAAAAFSGAARIKPKGRVALAVRLALPAVIAAKSRTKLRVNAGRCE